MTPELKASWLTALRSGDYRQGRGRMHHGDKFCCLGVLCDIAGYPWSKDPSNNTYTCPAGTYHIDQDADLEALGLTQAQMETCFCLNDGTFDKFQIAQFGPARRWTFAEIADWIEANIPATPATPAKSEGKA